MFPLPRARLFAVGIVLLLIAGVSCKGEEVGPSATPTRSAHVDKPKVKVALLAATSGGSTLSAIHAMQGARLAFDEANAKGDLPVDILAESSDTQEDPAVTADALAEIVSDPSYVAVIGWPSTPEAAEMAGTLADENLAYLNLSPAGGIEPGSGSAQLGMTGTDADQVSALSTYLTKTLKSKSVCLAGTKSEREEAILAQGASDFRDNGAAVSQLNPVLAEQDDYGKLVSQIQSSGCDTVFWSGGGTEAGVIRTQMTEADLGDIRLAGVDPVRTEAFLETAGPAGDGTIASCPCADVTVSTDLADQQFVQDYQARNGSPPAPFAAEGFDAASRIIEAVREGNADRESISAFTAKGQSFEGLTGSYAFDQQGHRLAPVIELSEDRRGTWTVVARTSAQS